MKTRMGFLSVAAVAAMTLLTGCDIGLFEGIYQGQAPNWSSAMGRTETEIVPNAQLYKEDTSPVFPAGRWGFRPGADRLLVITHITSVDTRDPDDSDKTLGQQHDKYIERIWLTIPLGTPIGQVIKAEDLNDKFLVGYDVAEVGSNEDKFFIQPINVKGKINVLQEDAKNGTALVDIDIIAAPRGLILWRLRETREVAVVPSGIRATRAVVTEAGALAAILRTPRPGDVGTGVGATTRPVIGPGEKAIVGRWIAARSSKDVFEYRVWALAAIEAST